MPCPHVAIVGAGWAGLATAFRLTNAGIQVTVFESASQAGGRARRSLFKQQPVDNGQHLLIGAYSETLSVMRQAGVDLNTALWQQPLKLVSKYPDGKTVTLTTSRLPAPLHLFWGLVTTRGLSWMDRWRAIQFGLRLKKGQLDQKQDVSVTTLLKREHQSDVLVEVLWNPLCLAIMNTHPAQASAQIFIKVLKDAFLQHNRDSDLLLPRCDLGCLFADPIIDYIESNGSHVHLGQRVTQLEIDANTITIHINQNNPLEFQHVVLATPPYATVRLLEHYSPLAPLSNRLSQFKYEPICTVYLQYLEHVQLAHPMLGMPGSTGQWIFDRLICNQPGLLAVIISSSGDHMNLENSQLVETIITELKQLFPDWPSPRASQVIRERRATFASCVDINKLRPDNQTAVNGLWLAGDYTATQYPATLEGAVRSGVQCANQILESIK